MGEQPLVEAWTSARDKGMRPLQVPGHKYRYARPDPPAQSPELAALVRDDISLQSRADHNYLRGKVLQRAEALWSASVGADQSRSWSAGHPTATSNVRW
jgi:hypothetical protein